MNRRHRDGELFVSEDAYDTPDGRDVRVRLTYRETTNLATDTNRTYGIVSIEQSIDGRPATRDEVLVALGTQP